MERQPNTQYVLSLSYGKDSLATIEACKRLGYPIDRIIHAEVWFNDEIPAELPPMVEFKAKADEIIRQRYGIQVERICAMRDGKKQTYEKMFYHIPTKKNATRGGGDLWIPSQLQQQRQADCNLVQESQRGGTAKGDKKSRAFPSGKVLTVSNSNRERSGERWGFPYRPRTEWCKELKKDNRVFRQPH